MQKLLNLIAVPLALALACSTTGCTIYGEKKPPTLKSTTSAEQYERIFWQMVEKQQWNKMPGLFSTTLVWNAAGKSLSSAEVVPYLQSLNIKDVVITDVSVQPNGPDMTVAYTLQYSGKSGQGCVGQMRALSVWQQVRGSYILIAHSEQPKGATCTAS
jgi:hypothetical protein